MIELRALGLAFAPHFLLALERREKHTPADVAGAAFGRHLIAEAASLVGFRPDVHPRIGAEMLVVRLEPAQARDTQSALRRFA